MLLLGFVYIFFGITFGFDNIGMNWNHEYLWLFVTIDVWYVSFILLTIKLWRDGKIKLPSIKWHIRKK